MYHSKFFEVFHIDLWKEFAIIMVDWPHLRIYECFSLFIVEDFIINLFLDLFAEVVPWRYLLFAVSFRSGRAPFSRIHFHHSHILLSDTLASDLACSFLIDFHINYGFLLDYWLFYLYFLLGLLNIDIAIFEIGIGFNVLFKGIEDLVLSELKPK